MLAHANRCFIGLLYTVVVENRAELVFVIDHQHRCIYANAAARRVLALAPGRDALIAVHPSDREVAAHVLDGVDGSFRCRVRAEGGWRWLEVSASATVDAGERQVVVFARDVTEQKRADDRAALQLAISRVLAESSDLDAITSPLLAAVCTGIGCEVGELWLMDDDQHRLRCAGQWHSDVLDARELASVTNAIMFESGVGVPGSVWQQVRPLIVPDISKDPGPFVRFEEALRLGLRTVIGLPIVHRDRLLAVLVVLGRDEQAQLDHDSIETLTVSGNQIAQFFARHRVESALRESADRFRAVVDFAPVLLLTVDRNGVVMFAQGRGMKLAGFPPRCPVGESSFELFRDSPAVVASIRRAVAGNTFSEMIEMNGRTFETVWTPLHDEGAIMVAVDITEQARAKAAVEAHYVASLREKEMMLKELHHRVKNNLQLAISLLALQAEKLGPDVERAVVQTQLRIKTMAAIHDHLSHSGELGTVDLGRHVEWICAQIYRAYGVDPTRIALVLQLAELEIGIDIAMPCGLVINELVANALKHAFPRDRRGTLEIRIDVAPAYFDLTVRDDGIGLATELDPAKTESLGLQLVSDLALQLRATMEIDRASGTAFRFRVPLPEARE